MVCTDPCGVSTWAAIKDDAGAEYAANGAPTCALDSGALGASGLPCGGRETADRSDLVEQPASIPSATSTAVTAPADRRPLIHLLSH